MNNLLSAIVDDEIATAKRLLRDDRSLATCLIQKPKLYQSKIFHWIYVGDTALHLAAAGYRVEIVKALVKAGADVNSAKNMRKSSPLHYAADGFITGPVWDAKRQVATIRCLLNHGADIHLQDMNGATPLHRAVRTRCAAAVKFLLAAGADPKIRNKPGSTPFHLAVQNTGRGGSGEPAAIEAQREIIRAFLEVGVSPKIKSSGGKSVVESATSEWVREMLRG
jgi:hypothetical protein